LHDNNLWLLAINDENGSHKQRAKWSKKKLRSVSYMHREGHIRATNEDSISVAELITDMLLIDRVGAYRGALAKAPLHLCLHQKWLEEAS